MQRLVPLVALCLGSLAAGSLMDRAAAGVTPVQKVITLLEGMLAKGKEEMHKEQVQFAQFKQFCDDTTRDKKRAITEAEDAIEMLKAEIQNAAEKAKQLADEIAKHDADIAAWTGDRKAAIGVREIENTDYKALHKDYSESVDALNRAIAVLKKQAYDRKQASESSLAQVSALKELKLIPAEAKRALDAFLQAEPEVTPPEAKGYEFQSSSIVATLEKLQDKFVDERTDLEKKEMNSKHAHELLLQDLTAQMDQATKDRGDKTEFRAKKLQKKADDQGDLTDTTTTMEADKKYLSNLEATCSQKGSDFETRQQLRGEELTAISKAIEIISGSAVQGHAEKHLPQLVQKKQVTALAQLRAAGAVASVQRRTADFLRDQAARLHSRVLSAVAAKVVDDPFVKVKKMIKDLIVRLMEEANEEAEHKGWCDTELATNEQRRKEKTDQVETLHAEIDGLDSSIAQLGEDLAQLAKEIAKLDNVMSKATTLRQKEKEENEETIKDAAEAQTAVAQALTVLKEFYAKAGDATALVQQGPPMPEIFDSPYTGMQAENGGVIGMLEVIESDFARLEAETTATEATAQKEYATLMTTSKVDKAAKATDHEHKTTKKQEQENARTVKKKDLELTEDELNKALAYYEKLKPSCVDAGVSYESRVARRKEEIQSLKEALRILNGEDIAL